MVTVPSWLVGGTGGCGFGLAGSTTGVVAALVGASECCALFGVGRAHADGFACFCCGQLVAAAGRACDWRRQLASHLVLHVGRDTVGIIDFWRSMSRPLSSSPVMVTVPS